MPNKSTQGNTTARPPVIVIMGHIDHGKSTLLDYIRKSNIVAGESGGITQHLSAYEVTHTTKEGVLNNQRLSDDHAKHDLVTQRITFLDTPGHEAFSQMRARGALVADIAVLVVSAEDGVKAQTKEALASILEAKIPYIVAINKIDKPAANVERTKNMLVENEIYIEGYGGDIPVVAISAKTGEGIPDLLDMMLLLADLQGLMGDIGKPAEGIVIEARVDPKKGISSTLIIKDGTLKKGMFVVAEDSLSPVRVVEDFLGRQVNEATFSSPIRITGFDSVPKVGTRFASYANKKEAEAQVAAFSEAARLGKSTQGVPIDETKMILPIIIKADVSGTLEAIEREIGKLATEKVTPKIIHRGAGTITENDIKVAAGADHPIILGFHVKTDNNARIMAERVGAQIELFDIIYKLTEWLAEEITRRTPVETVAEVRGKAQILRTFGSTKQKHVVGGRVTEGELLVGALVHIVRRGTEIGSGKIIELQQQKLKTEKVLEGAEFGAMIESKMEIATADIIEAVVMVQK